MRMIACRTFSVRSRLGGVARPFLPALVLSARPGSAGRSKTRHFRQQPLALILLRIVEHVLQEMPQDLPDLRTGRQAQRLQQVLATQRELTDGQGGRPARSAASRSPNLCRRGLLRRSRLAETQLAARTVSQSSSSAGGRGHQAAKLRPQEESA